MTKYGDPKANAILYEGFKEFMIEILGVSDSKEDILHSFHLINKGMLSFIFFVDVCICVKEKFLLFYNLFSP